MIAMFSVMSLTTEETDVEAFAVTVIAKLE